MTELKKQRILFLCTGNSARSQMAEALLRHKASDRFDVFSAGTHPDDIDPRTIEALTKFGLDTQDLASKNVSVFDGHAFDYVITLCDKASKECRSYPNAKKQFSWDFPDPKSRGGNTPFSLTLNELNSRLSMFLVVQEKLDTLRNSTTDVDMKEPRSDDDINVDPAVFYKSLTDALRLKTLMLMHYHGELCVCELMEALSEESQPKVSRNLAVLKKAKVIVDRKHGQWVFYRINPDLSLWAKAVISQTTENNISMITTELQRLDTMNNRPEKARFCTPELDKK
jgi:protein-tyrosine-phosphatase/DNA-binding transcriptional ArsR family regulator